MKIYKEIDVHVLTKLQHIMEIDEYKLYKFLNDSVSRGYSK